MAVRLRRKPGNESICEKSSVSRTSCSMMACVGISRRMPYKGLHAPVHVWYNLVASTHAVQMQSASFAVKSHQMSWISRWLDLCGGPFLDSLVSEPMSLNQGGGKIMVPIFIEPKCYKNCI